MRIIDRYISKQILGTVIWAIGVLSMLLVVGNAMRDLLTILVNRQLPLSYVFSFIAYALPFSLTYSIPWGVLVAILLIFGKLSSDNELVALRANGVGILRICFPVFVIASLFFALCLWINLYLSPESQVKLKSAIFNLASQDPLALFGSDQVIDDFPNRKIYVGRKERSSLEDLHIYELNAYQVPIRVINAHRGTLEVDKENQRILLRIFDARYEERDDHDPDNLRKMRYGITMQEGVLPISLSDLITKASNNQRPNLLTLDQLRDALEQQTGRMASAYRTEVSKRFSNAMAVITFVLVGIPLAITAQRRETSVGIALSLVVAFTYFIFIVITDNVKNTPRLHPELLIWLPNILYLTLGFTLFTRLARR
jgi:lipopolysaccharide export LptBFGC system permease protein LptF